MRYRVIIAILVLGLALGGCSQNDTTVLSEKIITPTALTETELEQYQNTSGAEQTNPGTVEPTTANISDHQDGQVKAEEIKNNTIKCNGAILYFHTQTCSPCREQGQILIQWIKDNRNKVAGLELIKMDLSLPENQIIAKQLEITHIPAFVVKNDNGSVIAKTVGVQNAEQIDRMIELLSDKFN